MNKRWPYSGKSKYRGKKRQMSVEPLDTEAYEVVAWFRENQEGRSIMNRFWDMLANSTLVQGVITLAVTGTTCYLWATGQPVPQELWTADGIILGFFFGAKTQQFVARGR